MGRHLRLAIAARKEHKLVGDVAAHHLVVQVELDAHGCTSARESGMAVLLSNTPSMAEMFCTAWGFTWTVHSP